MKSAWRAGLGVTKSPKKEKIKTKFKFFFSFFAESHLKDSSMTASWCLGGVTQSSIPVFGQTPERTLP
jgi:hypothetical protein